MAKAKARPTPTPERPEQPKNVAAVMRWFKQHRPDVEPMVADLFKQDEVTANERTAAVIGLILMGFEAGREFQREFPDVQSGIGY